MKKYTYKEYELYDGAVFITFNLIALKENEVSIAVTNRGKITVQEFDLKQRNGRYYFEYGVYAVKIFLDDFETITEGEFI
jgi:hypothetical protein